MPLTNVRFQRVSSIAGESSVAKKRTLVGPVRVPLSRPTTSLSNVRAPTTTNPRLINPGSVSARHDAIFPRTVDRGALGPILGRRQILPNGSVGGQNNNIRPIFRGIRGTAITATSMLHGAMIATEVKRQAVLSRFKSRKANVFLNPGRSGLDAAKAPRLVPDTPSGLRGVFREVHKKGIGVFAQHLTSPRASRNTLILQRIANKNKSMKGTDPKGVGVMASAYNEIQNTSQIALGSATDGEGASVGTGGIERFAFLGAAVMVAYLVLR